MRNLIQPPVSLHCDLCNGELRLKVIDAADPTIGLDVQIFICVQCGHQQSYTVSHDHYSAPHRLRPRPSLR
jgi:hypothetical protein